MTPMSSKAIPLIMDRQNKGSETHYKEDDSVGHER